MQNRHYSSTAVVAIALLLKLLLCETTIMQNEHATGASVRVAPLPTRTAGSRADFLGLGHWYHIYPGEESSVSVKDARFSTPSVHSEDRSGYTASSCSRDSPSGIRKKIVSITIGNTLRTAARILVSNDTRIMTILL